MITIANVAFTQVITMSQRFGNLTDIDGVLGLAFTSASVSGSDPPFIKAVKDGRIDLISLLHFRNLLNCQMF